MSTKSQIEKDIIDAMRSKQQSKLNALRFLKNAIQLVEKNDLSELDEDGVQKVVAKQVKDRKESIKMFEQGGRDDLVLKETEELQIIEQYLPPQMSEEDIEAIVAEAISSMGASSLQDKGKVMGYCMKQLQGNADGTIVNDIVTKLLTD
ncbi:MAG: GatB/YqeY domain-containing protein [Dehalococcoidia bacterium]|tara:strand:+ start:4628 stop:5074 length:447 start_codon:yes stop_codon:yes gene_type:complete